MKRSAADRIAVAALVLVSLAGLYGTGQASSRSRAVGGPMGSMMDGGMMGGSAMGGASGVDPIWYVLATVVAVAVVGGVYVAARDQITDGPDVEPSAGSPPEASTSAGPNSDDAGESDHSSSGTIVRRGRRTLDLLPEDERRVLEPVIASPGVTQIELRDRSDFSKSKVSQTVSDLEKRGLLYRERQGRTYRVYPDESLPEA